MSAQWQIRFDDGHQQRYLPDRQAVLRYVLGVGLRAASPRFEVFHESDPVVLGDGSPGGRVFFRRAVAAALCPTFEPVSGRVGLRFPGKAIFWGRDRTAGAFAAAARPNLETKWTQR